MSGASAAWAAFAREVARTGRVWTLRDESGFPAPRAGDGGRAMPFWSSRSRVEKITASAPAYGTFVPHEIAWSEFRDRWLPGLARDGLLVGVNWSGARATGFDVEPEAVRVRVEQAIAERPSDARGS